VRAVAHVPTTVHRKLLVGFGAIVVLLVTIGALGLRVLGESNNRIELLGSLQQRAAAYRALQNDNAQLRLLLGLRAGGVDIENLVGSSAASAPTDASLTSSDERIESTIRQLRQSYDPAHLGFVPPAEEEGTLRQIQTDYERFSAVMTSIVQLDRAGKASDGQQLQATQAEPIAIALERLTDLLVNTVQANTVYLIDQNRSSYLDSQHLFVGFAGASIVLALLLGLVLSWSLIGPIRRMNTRLAAIASGDFSGHVDVPNRDELGALAANLNRMNDELGRLYKDLEAASQHKSEFLANMSHELRTPLNAIIGFSEVLLEEMFGPLNERQADYLKDILESGRHLLVLINDILDLSKIEAGRMELQVTTFSLPAVLENGVTMVRERAAGHGIALEVDLGPGVSTVEADEVKVKQVVYNLLSNAVKFTPDGGRIDLIARRLDGHVHVAVRDTGIGIDAADRKRIFEEFQQAGQREGSGLGLALARSFVELHGGELWVESEPGVGSTFTFTLPLRQSAQDAPAGADANGVTQSESLPLTGQTILVIEDDQHSIELLSLYLEGAGFHTVVCRDGELGIETARELHPAAIILDIVLPRLNGWDFLTVAKADETTAHIPVIIVSMLDDRGKGFALGAADYLVKPVSRDDLLATLQPFVTTRRGANGAFKILAIDDDPLALELIETVLGAEGFPVLRALGGEEGVETARRELPALIILDLLMPGVDGFTVVERLRADRSTADIPIVVLTSKTISQEDRERLNSGVSHLAAKSQFSRGQFVELVRRFCTAPQA
jgi:signal transduction histidine kinase/DNA-binding response OmpR family regulator